MNKKTIIRAIVGLSLPMAMAACSQGGYSGFPYELESSQDDTADRLALHAEPE